MPLQVGHVDLLHDVLEGIRVAESKMRAGAQEFKDLVQRLQAFTGGGTAVGSRRRGRPPGRPAGVRTKGSRRGGKRGPQKGSLPYRILAFLESHSGHHSSAALLDGLGLPKKKRQQLASTLSHLKRDGMLKHSPGQGYSSAG
jgi:hypothetical protein